MNEKGPSNCGDGVNEELPHRPDTVCDGGCCLEIFRTVIILPSSSVLLSSSSSSLLLIFIINNIFTIFTITELDYIK